MSTLGPHGFVKRMLWEVYIFVHLSIAGKGKQVGNKYIKGRRGKRGDM